MNDNRKLRTYSSSQIGISFMLVMLIILCLIVFASLSLTSALKDYDYSTQIANHTKAYYDASSKAYEIADLAEECVSNTSDTKLLVSKLKDKDIKDKADDYTVSLSKSKGKVVIDYSVPIEKGQILSVSLLLDSKKGENGHYYAVKKWSEQNTSDWENDEKIPVLKIN